MSIFSFPPAWAAVAAVNWARLIAQDEVIDGIPIPSSVNGWVQFLLGTGGPLAIGWFWYRKYLQTVLERSEFLSKEIAESRAEIVSLRTARAVMSEELFSTMTQLHEAKIELAKTQSESEILREQRSQMMNTLQNHGIHFEQVWFENQPKGEIDE